MAEKLSLRLGVNIDHVATLRNARGGVHPDPIRAAIIAAEAGADGITAHLREDRRHITDDDIARLRQESKLPLNLEMAAADEMIAIALKTKPHAVCVVPEKRTEITTEGGLNVAGNIEFLKPKILALKNAGIRVSLFIDPDTLQIEAAKAAGADIVELHTGQYCKTQSGTIAWKKELAALVAGAQNANKLGLECHAGHGLSFADVGPVAAIAEIVELNIGHFLIGEAIFLSLKEAIERMKRLMQGARDDSGHW